MNQLKSFLPRTDRIFYHFVRFLVVNPIFGLYFRGRVTGAELVPREGKLVIVSNHASVFDPPLLASAIPRPISYMAKEELFQQSVLSKLISSLGAYPVNRQGFDRRAIKQAISQLEQGWAIGIFIEGTRTADGRVHDPKLGAALIAAKTQAPLLPVCLCGTEKIILPEKKFPQPAQIKVKIGNLIQPPESVKREELELVTQKCAEVINAMQEN